MNSYFKFLNNILIANEPVKSIIISLIVSTTICISVLVIGFLIEKLEYIEVFILRKIVKSSKRAIFIEDRLTFPGTMLHEMAHAFFAWLTGAQIQKIRLLKFFDAHKLGEVLYCPKGTKLQRCFQMSATSCAPVIMGLIELNLLIKLWSIYTNSYIHALIIYLFICIFNHMSMSDADIKGYLTGMKYLYPVIFLICYAIRIYIYR